MYTIPSFVLSWLNHRKLTLSYRLIRQEIDSKRTVKAKNKKNKKKSTKNRLIAADSLTINRLHEICNNTFHHCIQETSRVFKQNQGISNWHEWLLLISCQPCLIVHRFLESITEAACTCTKPVWKLPPLYHICSLIFFPSSSMVRILKSIPARHIHTGQFHSIAQWETKIQP